VQAVWFNLIKVITEGNIFIFAFSTLFLHLWPEKLQQTVSIKGAGLGGVSPQLMTDSQITTIKLIEDLKLRFPVLMAVLD